MYVKVLIDKEGKEVDLLSAVSTKKSRSYSFEMTPEEENVEVHSMYALNALYMEERIVKWFIIITHVHCTV